MIGLVASMYSLMSNKIGDLWCYKQKQVNKNEVNKRLIGLPVKKPRRSLHGGISRVSFCRELEHAFVARSTV